MKLHVLLLFILCIVPVNAQINTYVTDHANIFTSEQKAFLDQELSDFEKQTSGAQLVVFTENNVPQGMTLEERSLQLAEQGGIGTVRDNGVLLYIALDDHLYRWEVGYGVEDVLNTPFLGRVSREVMVPLFEEGKVGQGVINGVAVIKRKMLGSEDADIFSPKEQKTNMRLIVGVIAAVFFIIVLGSIISGGKKGKLNDKVYIQAASFLFSAALKGSKKFGGGGSFGGGGFSGEW